MGAGCGIELWVLFVMVLCRNSSASGSKNEGGKLPIGRRIRGDEERELSDDERWQGPPRQHPPPLTRFGEGGGVGNFN